MTAASFLIEFVKKREKAYSFYPQKSLKKLAAISKIKKACKFYAASKKTGWVQGIKEEILLILPGEDSPFQELRNEVLTLLDNINNNN